MPATANYQAGVETNATQISYAIETTWGVAPAVPFQAIRYTSESLAETKTRQRPSEIVNAREATQGVTTQQQAAGTINYALSAQTFDDFMSVITQSDWGATIALAGIAGDIVLTNTSGVITLSSTLTTKFTALVQGSWIRLLGFTNAQNNDWWYIAVKTSNQLMTLTGRNSATAVTETPAGTAAQIRSCTLRNGTTFKSVFLQQQFSSSLFLTYAGAYVSKMSVQGGIGNFMTGAIDLVAKQEVNGVTNSSTGAVVAAPTTRVMDPVNSWVAGLWNEQVFSSSVDQFVLTMENTSAAPEFAMGSVAAVGMLGGTFMASGSFRAYFKDFSQYALFAAETSGRLSFILKDSVTGYSYAFTFLNAILLGKINAGGPGQPVYAEFDVEGGPGPNSGTLVIDRLAGV